ncbi:hypothetical protein QJQ45_030144 [Haematococcus lacustris]|nr:hypothetical protein QJQ45_030144 [Haematococcus lacustris]
MRVATGEMNWWPEAFPCRAAFAAVGLATRGYIPIKHWVLFLTKSRNGFVTVERVGEDACHGRYLIVFGRASVLLGCVVGALQQPGGYPQVAPHLPSPLSSARLEHLDTVKSHLCSSVDHHQPEQPVSLPGAPQPQFDNEAELARVAQFQEHFRELDQALTALQPLPGPPAQPTGTPLRLFNRFAVLDLESVTACACGARMSNPPQPCGAQCRGSMPLEPMPMLLDKEAARQAALNAECIRLMVLDTPGMPQFDTLNKDLLKAWCKHNNIRGVSSKSKNELRDMCLLKLRKKVEAPRHM